MLGQNQMNKQTGSLYVLMCLVAMAAGLLWVPTASAITPVPVGTGVQCPNDIDNHDPSDAAYVRYSTPPGPEDFDWNDNGVWDQADGTALDPNVVCKRIGVSDGYAKLPNDPENMYLFGFMDLTGIPEADIVNHRFRAELPAPVIDVAEGQELFVTLTNLSLVVRPDLADPHTIHFHGYPHAMAVFDGVPELSASVPGGSDFTYYYKLNDAGTYPYHCHVEPTEHLELGMVGTIVVRPLQDGVDGVGDALTGNYAYNDGGNAPDTSYDKAFELHLHDLDGTMHYNLETVQEGTSEWYTYSPHYFTFNGRAYPETLLPANSPLMMNSGSTYKDDYISQPQSALIEANVGDRVLLRLINLAYKEHTLALPGIPMHVVGEDSRLLRGTGGQDLSYHKTTYALAGGKTADIILETAGLTPGTYFLYGRELYSQSNLSLLDREATKELNDAGDPTKLGAENRGGLITEIWIR